MDKSQYEEMINNISIMESNKSLIEKKIYIFGHCNASEELVDVLLEHGYNIEAVLDNNTEKHGKDYRGIPIVSPAYIIENEYGPSAVLIVTRFYETMNKQLRSMGYNGEIYKLVDYNTYAEYSLSEDTISRKKERVENGRILVKRLEDKYPGHFRIFCPFNALGDIYFAMSYLPYYMKKRSIDKCVICVPDAACAKVVRLFGDYSMEVLLIELSVSYFTCFVWWFLNEKKLTEEEIIDIAGHYARILEHNKPHCSKFLNKLKQDKDLALGVFYMLLGV